MLIKEETVVNKFRITLIFIQRVQRAQNHEKYNLTIVKYFKREDQQINISFKNIQEEVCPCSK